MGALALDRLLREISADQPCGPAIESDAEERKDAYNHFLKLVNTAKPAPLRWDGTKDIPGKPPDWPEVEKLSLELFEGVDGVSGSKDLRVAVLLARARLHVAGLPGLAEGLHLVRELLDSYWDGVHPRIQIENGKEDASQRTNALAPLGTRVEFGNIVNGEVDNEVRRTPLITVPGLGPIGWRDIEIAKRGGKPSGPGDAHTLTAAQIGGVFAECKNKGRESLKEQLFTSYRGARDARDHMLAITATLEERVGSGEPAGLDVLQKLLASIVALLTEKITALGLAVEAGIATDEAPSPEVLQPGRSAPGSAPSLPGEIASRDDVRATLQKVCDYYDRCEPSSPLPILLKRALRLVDKSFVEIVKDLAPGGLAQVEQLRGADSEEEKK